MVLQKYSSWLLENRLDDLAKCNLEQLRTMDLGIAKVFANEPYEKRLAIVRTSIEGFLKSLENDTAYERLHNILHRWEQDKLNYNLSKNDFQPSDLVMAQQAQMMAMVKFLPDYTSDVSIAMDIVKMLTHYQSTAEKIGFETYAKIREETEDRFRLLVSSVKEYAIYGLDKDGVIRTWNLGAERVKGYKAEEVIGKNYSIFYTEEEQKANKPAKDLEIAAHQGIFLEEAWRVRKDGTRFLANIVITPIYNKDNELIGFAKVTRDQTEEHRYEQQLTQKNEELSRYIADLEQFAHLASHDLKEPLRMISIYVQLLEQHFKEVTDPQVQEYSAYVNEGVSRIYDLINDLLAYTSIRQTTVPHESVDVNDVLDSVKRSLEKEIGATSARIISEDLPVVNSFRPYMVMLFRCLVDNGIKFHKENENPVVEIKARSKNGFWIFSVKDNGIGVEERYQEKIFGMFQRLHPRDKYPGTGVGLSIAKKIVNIYGGKIWLESEPGKGSTFYFSLPIKPKD